MNSKCYENVLIIILDWPITSYGMFMMSNFNQLGIDNVDL